MDVHIGTSRCPLAAHLKKQQATIPLDLDLLTYFKKDGKGLLAHMNAALRELAVLTPNKGK
ncbi:MAG: BrnA antitoxin family protein [Candidatus Puniceispirillaceae bacterium]